MALRRSHLDFGMRKTIPKRAENREGEASASISTPLTQNFFSLCPPRSPQIHSMDFDDTWHPTTHPSGPVLSALMAVAEGVAEKQRISGCDLLLAFNVGIEVQGRLMSFSKEASNLPKRSVCLFVCF